jgi:Type I phosphodiesterase / nucleotide pyrophosphatase.
LFRIVECIAWDIGTFGSDLRMKSEDVRIVWWNMVFPCTWIPLILFILQYHLKQKALLHIFQYSQKAWQFLYTFSTKSVTEAVKGFIWTLFSVNLSCTVVVGNGDDIYSALKNASIELGHFSVYRKKEILERWHYKNNRRAPPILVLADESYAFDDMYQYVEFYEKLKNETSKFQLYIVIHLVRHLIDDIAVQSCVA